MHMLPSLEQVINLLTILNHAKLKLVKKDLTYNPNDSISVTQGPKAL